MPDVEIDSTLAGGPTEEQTLLVRVTAQAVSPAYLASAIQVAMEDTIETDFDAAWHVVEAEAIRDIWLRLAQDYVDAVAYTCPHGHLASELVYDLDDCYECDMDDAVNYVLGHVLGVQSVMTALGLKFELEFPQPSATPSGQKSLGAEYMECSVDLLREATWCETHDSLWSNYGSQDECDAAAARHALA